MAAVISFRPTREEARIIESTRRRLRLPNRSDTLRYLIRRAAADDEDPTERFFALRVPEEFRLKGRSITPEEIDEVVYGDHIWRPDSG